MAEEVGCQLLRLWQKLWLRFEDLNLCVNCPIICVLAVYILLKVD